MRRFLIAAAVAFGLLGPLLPVLRNIHAAEPTAGEKPYIIFILGDDLGYGDLCC
ncbi:MAG: hypothetical protein MK554_01420 [Planctomycetes bacterium]|nr:hypothetical protein [Planctomycetota bacterium]